MHGLMAINTNERDIIVKKQNWQMLFFASACRRKIAFLLIDLLMTTQNYVRTTY